jgi:hypothetical protein
MAYDPATNPPARIGGQLCGAGPLATGGPTLWLYQSSDTAATVAEDNYFSNAAQLGMASYDWVVIIDTTTPLLVSFLVHSVSADGAILGQSGMTIGN